MGAARRIASPIQQLTSFAQEVREGNLQARSAIATTDETGVLAQTLNGVLEQVNELLARTKEDQKRKRKYELDLMQEQIKPHFLYNTIDLIYVLVETGQTEKAASTTKALADYFRTSLGGGREAITLREEIQTVENYLLIQRERYIDILEYKIEVDPSIYSYTILRLTLQPLVENAIYHGLRSTGEPGCVTVRGRLENGNVVLEVEDTGAGMPPGRLAEVLAPQGTRHFGLRSVQERIRLHYGEGYGLTVENRPGQPGTLVRILIPGREEDTDDQPAIG